MRLVVVLEQRFDRNPQGVIQTAGPFAYPFWNRYLEVFETVRVVARVRDVAHAADQQRADGLGVQFLPVPYYLGPWQYLRHFRLVRQALRESVGQRDAVILRVGSQLANCLFPTLKRQRRPFGVEVVGDPWDVFAPGVVRHPLRPILRRYFTRQLRYQCHFACGAAYVTQHALQSRYPVGNDRFSTSYSSIELPAEAIGSLSASAEMLGRWGERPGVCSPNPSCPAPLRLVFIGSLEQLYKGPDVLVEAMARCVREGWNVRLRMIGEGRFRPQLQTRCRRLGIEERVDFVGQLPAGEAVRAELDRADLFVLPSRTEGLPRALIEAMARGLPSVGSAVGGIPELLPPEDLVRPGDAGQLAAKIVEILGNPERRGAMAKRNLMRAGDFREELLRRRRQEFYRHVRDCTADWCQRSQNRPKFAGCTGADNRG